MSKAVEVFKSLANEISVNEVLEWCVDAGMSADQIISLVPGTEVELVPPKWGKPEDYLFEHDSKSYQFRMLDETGGGEGGGDYVQRIVGVFEKVDSVCVYIGAVEIEGFYSSYDGIDWNDEDTFESVVPKAITAIDWVTE